MAAAAGKQVFIDESTLWSLLTYDSLIHHLRSSLPAHFQSLHSPLRHSHSLPSSSSLLLMPSWSSTPLLPYLGVKLVTHFPNNPLHHLPAVHASYLLFSATAGVPLASLDGTQLTLLRTACVSALASSYLSRPDAAVLVMVGAGALAPHFIKAHLAVRPGIRKILIWNRTAAKATDLATRMREEGYGRVEFASTENLDEAIGLADIVSCATNSQVALVKGRAVKGGAHLDLVGSYKVSMKECDDEAIKKGRVFVDDWAALEEAGELIGAMERGIISKKDILGNLVELIEGKIDGRTSSEEITVFKSVGSAAVDLLTAQLVYETYMKKQGNL